MSKNLKEIIEGVVGGGKPGKPETKTPGNDTQKASPKAGSDGANDETIKGDSKEKEQPDVATDVEVKNKDSKKVQSQTTRAKQPGPNVAGKEGIIKQGSSDAVKEESTPETKAGLAKSIFDVLREMDHAELEARFPNILEAILDEKADDEDKDEDEDEVAEGEKPSFKKGVNPFPKKGEKDADSDDDKEDVKENKPGEPYGVGKKKDMKKENVGPDGIKGTKDDEDYPEDEDGKMKKEATAIVSVARRQLTKEDIDVSADVAALLASDSSLSEEFLTGAKTIFEAAVLSKVNETLDTLEEQFVAEVATAREEYETSLKSKIDGYLNYVVEQWMEENELAVERGIRSELTEDFIRGLKNLFVEHYIEIPEEKVNVVDGLAERVETLQNELNESIEANIDLKSSLNEAKKREILQRLSDGLALTQAEKLESLAEGVSFEDTDQYQTAVATLKEGYFPKSPKNVEEEDVDKDLSQTLTEEATSGPMSRYVKSIERQVK